MVLPATISCVLLSLIGSGAIATRTLFSVQLPSGSPTPAVYGGLQMASLLKPDSKVLSCCLDCARRSSSCPGVRYTVSTGDCLTLDGPGTFGDAATDELFFRKSSDAVSPSKDAMTSTITSSPAAHTSTASATDAVKNEQSTSQYGGSPMLTHGASTGIPVLNTSPSLTTSSNLHLPIAGSTTNQDVSRGSSSAENLGSFLTGENTTGAPGKETTHQVAQSLSTGSATSHALPTVAVTDSACCTVAHWPTESVPTSKIDNQLTTKLASATHYHSSLEAVSTPGAETSSLVHVSDGTTRTSSTNAMQLATTDCTGACHVASSFAGLLPTPATTIYGLLGDVTNAVLIGNKSCGNIQCPVNSICLDDCNGTSCEPVCAGNAGECAGNYIVVGSKHCYTPTIYDVNTQTGVVQSATFRKMAANTALRVQWYATTTAHYLSAYNCGRYYVTFNGTECTDPATIEFSNYDMSLNDHRRMSELDGICNNLPAGLITVAINVGACPEYSSGIFRTGWNAGRSMWILEILPSESCAIVPVSNIEQLAITNLNSSAKPDSIVMSMVYTKKRSNTALRVKWMAMTRIYVLNNTDYCSRWYVTVNGTECNPKIEFLLGMFASTFSYSRDNRKTRTMEGLCYNLTAGVYLLTVRVGYCDQYITLLPDTHTGCCSSVSRFMVDEVVIGSKMQAVTTSNGTIFKLPFFNFVHYSWYSINDSTTAGVLKTMTYKKFSNSTGIHIHLIGDSRIFASYGCCRWYFAIDGSECANPGPIEGISYTDNAAYYHSPGVIDGTCYGYMSGVHTIQYMVGQCRNSILFGCFTGLSSTINVMVDEVQVAEAVVCPNPRAC